MTSRLVERLRIWTPFSPGLVVPFIDKGLAAFLNAVLAGGAGPQAHQDDSTTASEAKVHTGLEVHSLLLAHLQV